MMTMDDWKDLGEMLAIATRKHVSEEFAKLETRIKELEARPVLNYEGVWESKAYSAGSCVTYDGCLWIARSATDQRPSTPDSGWQLAVKKGRDAR